MLTMTQVETQIKQFSLDEQLHLLSFIADQAKMQFSLKIVHPQKMPIRQPGGLTGKFRMASDFDDTPDCFQEYT